MSYRTQVEALCDKCIEEGEKLISTQWSQNRLGHFTIANPTTYVDLEKFSKWHSNCLVLMELIGQANKPWQNYLNKNSANTLINTTNIIGSLKSIKETIQIGLLTKAEAIINAETFSNLIEQAEYLLEHGYLLAAGVILRAVLEEKLRNIIKEKGIAIQKNKPTLNDYCTELYKSAIIDKILYKHIDSLVAIGNEAAHNMPITETNIKDLLSGTKDVLHKLS